MTEDTGQYKFQRLHVYQLGLEYVDRVYALTHLFPESERFNLRSQLERAATSIVLNIAEGSTSQSDAEQRRFLALALRSYIETVACLDLVERRGFLRPAQVGSLRELGHQLFVKFCVLESMKQNKRRDSISLAQLLCCPFCGGELSGTEQIGDKSGFGVLSCYCGRYPIVAGIPILKKGVIGTDHQTADQVINSIEAGRHKEALLAMILPSPPSAEFAPRWLQALPPFRGMGRIKTLIGKPALGSWKSNGVAYLTQLGDQITGRKLFDFYFCHSTGDAREPYGYFAFRFGQPRHLVALSLSCLIRRPRKLVLDLACGFGHITRHLVSRAQGQPVIGLDRNFFMLYIANNWLAPEAKYVCAQADSGLPFPADSFSTVMCSDAFHVFPEKANCFRELKRLVGSDGSIILATLRNILVEKPLDQYLTSLPPEGYETLAASMPHRLLANSDILARYLKKQGPPLEQPTNAARLTNEPWLSLVASFRQEVFQDYGCFRDWPHAEGRLDLNQLYKEEKRDGDGNIYLRRTFPSAWYEKEDGDCKQYEPETVFVSAETLNNLAQGTRSTDVERLIEQFVVVGMPERYS